MNIQIAAMSFDSAGIRVPYQLCLSTATAASIVPKPRGTQHVKTHIMGNL